MGQVYLGFRSLLLKFAVFVVMAALLAWAIGGTLWPRTAVGIVGASVRVGGHSIALVDRLRSDGSRSSFALALLDEAGLVTTFWPPRSGEADRTWNDAMSPVVDPEGNRGAAAYRVGDRWSVVEFKAGSGGGHPLQPESPVTREVGGRLEAARILDSFARGGTDQSAGPEANATGETSSAG